MNFNAQCEFMCLGEQSLDILPSVSNLNNVSDITSIINSFENGTLLQTSKTCNSNAKQYFLNVLDWINRDFIPVSIYKIAHLNSNEIKDCHNITMLIKKKLKQINTALNSAKRSQREQPRMFTCNTCSTNIGINYKDNFWNSIQEHNHFEEALIKPFNENIPLITEQTLLTNGTNMIQKPLEIQTNTMQQLTKPICTTCRHIINKSNNFKFNFPVSYDSIIEDVIYGANSAEGIYNREVKIIQLKGKNLFTCLLCRCDMPLQGNSKIVKQHMSGRRHLTLEKSATAVDALLVYHDYWRGQELSHQAHQIYFLPITRTETYCTLCLSTVFYHNVKEHLNIKQHKDFVLQNNKRNKSQLVKLQTLAYVAENKPISDDSEECDEKPNQSMVRSSHRITVNMDKRRSDDSDDSEPSTSTADSKPFDTIYNTKRTHQDTQKKEVKAHSVIKSFSNNSELESLIQHRFLPHFKNSMLLKKDFVHCFACKTNIAKENPLIVEHICSEKHKIESNVPYVSYRMYCEICDAFYKQNITWFKHLKLQSHIDRCEKLGATRKGRLKEYECETCRTIIFGDELSIRRHNATFTKGIRYRKNKEIILGEGLKAFFKSEQKINEQRNILVTEANQVLINSDRSTKCCEALREALAEAYPNCQVHPFGSRVSGLGNEQSDLDLFVDLGEMYEGLKAQESHSQEKFVYTAAKIFRRRKREFQDVNPIATARTPIVQVFHISSGLDCDLSFRHGLSVENTKFLRLCIELQPHTQSLILLLKRWLDFCKLEYITTYALSMMVIFHFQTLGYLVPVHELNKFNSNEVRIIDGWKVVDFSSISKAIHKQVKRYEGSVKLLLKEFFFYYSNFAFQTDVICPLLGRTVKKSVLSDKESNKDFPVEMLSYIQKLSNPDAEYFRALSPFCIQDPFDLSHNLTKACNQNTVDKFKVLCNLTLKHLNSTN